MHMAGRRTAAVTLVIVAALLAASCGRADGADRRPPPAANAEPPRADTGFASESAGAHVTLARAFALRWTTRELRHMPKYLQLVGWRSHDTLVALAGENPVEIDVRTSAFLAWNRRATGAQLAPHGRRLAWADRGDYWVGERGTPPRLVLPYGRVKAPGDPSGAIRWSPEGRRIATWWMEESAVTNVIIDLARDTAWTFETGLPRYMRGGTAFWLDTARLLLNVTVWLAKSGADEYKESGHRAELAVCDLSAGGCRLVTDVADGVFLRPVARWGPRGILVSEHLHGQRTSRLVPRTSRFAVYSIDGWERQPISLPAGPAVAVAPDASLAVAAAPRTRTTPPDVTPNDTTVLVLWEASSNAVRPLARVLGGEVQLSWCPAGDRLAILSAEVVVVPPSEGYRGRWRLTLLERR
jgi:hypothetical protein